MESQIIRLLFKPKNPCGLIMKIQYNKLFVSRLNLETDVELLAGTILGTLWIVMQIFLSLDLILLSDESGTVNFNKLFDIEAGFGGPE